MMIKELIYIYFDGVYLIQHKQIQKNKKVNCIEFDQSPNG